MKRTPSFRAASTLAVLLLLAAAALAQLLSPQARIKVMDKIRDKYAGLAALPIAQRRQQTAAYAKTLPEILSARVTEDGNIACAFKDKVPYMILGNVGVAKPKAGADKALALRLHSPVRTYSADFLHALGLPDPAQPTLTQGFEANDLPDSVDARICNALGKSFGNSTDEVRRILSNKGYTVAPGTDASIETLMKHVKGLGVFYMQCHGGNGSVWNAAENKWEDQYIIVSGEEHSAPKELAIQGLVAPEGPGLITHGYIGMCEAVYDVRDGKQVINKRWFTITKKFVQTFWRFSKNSFVLIYGCNTSKAGDVMATSAVNASVYVGTDNLGNVACHQWIKLLFDRLTGTNDDTIPPPEDTVGQRPFDWVSLFKDFKDRKRMWPTTETYHGAPHPCNPIFRANRDNFGLLTPSIRNVAPVAFQQRVDLFGIFGKDPGNGNRSVTIGGVAQVVEKWEPDKITILLGNASQGTSGEVIVFHKNRPSNSRFLSKWTGNIKVTITGEQSLEMKADFAVHMIGDPWTYREQPGVKPVEPFVWAVSTSSGSTCTWGASGEEKDSDGTVLRKWHGSGTPRCWLDDFRSRQNTFGVGGAAVSMERKMNLYLAIVSTFTLTEHGTAESNTPIKLGDWMDGQTLFKASYDTNFNIQGDRREIQDEPSKLSYGGKNAILIWDSMQCRNGMPRAAPR